MITPEEQPAPPETLFNTTLLNVLKLVDLAVGETSPLEVAGNKVELKSGPTQLLKVTEREVVIAERNFEDRLINTKKSEVSMRHIDIFLEALKPHLVRLNHVGV